MQQIAEWLEKLGMSEYAQRFIENRIDFEVLSDLTDQDLEKLGVVLGDRRKMLRAIAKLENAAAQPSDAPSAAAASPTARTSLSEVVLGLISIPRLPPFWTWAARSPRSSATGFTISRCEYVAGL